MGAEFETPHEFKAGDTISAEMMNELFGYIKNSQQSIISSDIVGTWSCQIYSGDNGCNEWTTGTDSLYYYTTGTITFVDDGDGTYSYQTTKQHIIFDYPIS